LPDKSLRLGRPLDKLGARKSYSKMGRTSTQSVALSLIKKTQRFSWLSLKPCNTSEMTLGRALELDLGILFDSE
jgi:hypothetical protein